MSTHGTIRSRCCSVHMKARVCLRSIVSSIEHAAIHQRGALTNRLSSETPATPHIEQRPSRPPVGDSSSPGRAAGGLRGERPEVLKRCRHAIATTDGVKPDAETRDQCAPRDRGGRLVATARACARSICASRSGLRPRSPPAFGACRATVRPRSRSRSDTTSEGAGSLFRLRDGELG